MNPAKTAEPIEIPFGMWAPAGPHNHVLDGGSDPPRDRGNLGMGICGRARACPRSAFSRRCGLLSNFLSVFVLNV